MRYQSSWPRALAASSMASVVSLAYLIPSMGSITTARRERCDMNEKVYTAWFPEFCAPTLVTRDMASMAAFAREFDRIVVKPLHGMGGPGHQVAAEFNSKPHKRGVLSMARSNDPNSAGSQFFICVADANFLDWKYTAFGEVVSGMEIADKIVNVKRDGRDNPLERVEMTVTIKE